MIMTREWEKNLPNTLENDMVSQKMEVWKPFHLWASQEPFHFSAQFYNYN